MDIDPIADRFKHIVGQSTLSGFAAPDLRARLSPRTAGERPSSTADLAVPRKETPNYPPQRQTLESHVRRQFPETETKSL